MSALDLRIFAVVPAAGQSRRMGRPKALLPIGDSTLIARLLAALDLPQVACRVVVIRPGDAALRAAVQAAGGVVVEPATAPPSMRDSVECALRHVQRTLAPAITDAWLLCPVDHPLLDQALVANCIARWRASRPAILVPTHNGRRGHPVLFSWKLAEEAIHLPANQGINVLAALHAGELQTFEAGTAAVLADLDTPEDYARLVASATTDNAV